MPFWRSGRFSTTCSISRRSSTCTVWYASTWTIRSAPPVPAMKALDPVEHQQPPPLDVALVDRGVRRDIVGVIAHATHPIQAEVADQLVFGHAQRVPIGHRRRELLLRESPLTGRGHDATVQL